MSLLLWLDVGNILSLSCWFAESNCMAKISLAFVVSYLLPLPQPNHMTVQCPALFSPALALDAGI